MQYPLPPSTAQGEVPPLYYLHIPKTAGTSLVAFLDAQFAAKDICPAQLLPALFALGCARASRYRLYRGHLWYGLARYLGQPLRLLTVLRDPLQRTLSWYSHARRDPNAYRHDRMVEERWSLQDFVTDPQTQWDMVNTQTLFLAADLDYEQLALDPVGYGRRTIRALAERRDDRRLLETAKRRLEAMDFGITERMWESVGLFSHVFGLDPEVPVARLNVSPHRAIEVTAAERAAIDEITRLDRELYDWACGRFSERFDAMVQELVSAEARRSGTTGRAWRMPLLADSRQWLAIESVRCARTLPVDEVVAVELIVRNDSTELLSSRPPNPIHVAYHWIDANSGESVVFDGERTALPAVVAAGERVPVVASVRSPPRPGRFWLQMRLVQEGVCWIESHDASADSEIIVGGD